MHTNSCSWLMTLSHLLPSTQTRVCISTPVFLLEFRLLPQFFREQWKTCKGNSSCQCLPWWHSCDWWECRGTSWASLWGSINDPEGRDAPKKAKCSFIMISLGHVITWSLKPVSVQQLRKLEQYVMLLLLLMCLVHFTLVSYLISLPYLHLFTHYCRWTHLGNGTTTTGSFQLCQELSSFLTDSYSLQQ